MLGLIENLKTELDGVITGMRSKDIFFAVAVDILPGGTRLPCIGIRGGTTVLHELTGNVIEKELPVEIYLYDRLTPGDDIITAFLRKCELISNRLKNNYLGGYIQDASPVLETPINMMYRPKGLILRKGMFYKYEREE